jgi:hypothetical protein
MKKIFKGDSTGTGKSPFCILAAPENGLHRNDTDSRDVRQYVKRMQQRDPELNSYWGTICTPLEMTAAAGKRNRAER